MPPILPRPPMTRQPAPAVPPPAPDVRPIEDVRRLIDRVVDTRPVAGGFSGAEVYRVIDGDGRTFAVRRWPTGVDGDHVDAVHRRQFDWTPWTLSPLVFSDGTTRRTDADGRHWDATPWSDGVPLSDDADPAAIVDAVAVIGRFHRETGDIPSVRGRSSTIAARVAGRRMLDGAVRAALESGSDDPVSRLLRRGGAVASRRIERLRRFDDAAVRVCPRDLHREHLLLRPGDGHPPAHIIDLDAAAPDRPESDVARYLGSFPDVAAEADDPTVRQAVESYGGGLDRVLVAELMHATDWIAMARWWMRLRSDPPADRVTAAERMNRWARRVERTGPAG